MVFFERVLLPVTLRKQRANFREEIDPSSAYLKIASGRSFERGPIAAQLASSFLWNDACTLVHSNFIEGHRHSLSE